MNYKTTSTLLCLPLCVSTLALANSNITRDTNEISTQNLKNQLSKQQAELTELSRKLEFLKRKSTGDGTKTPMGNKPWQISSYGSLLYKSADIFANSQDTSPTRRAKTDLERVVTEFNYRFDPQWKIEVEIEYEHGGTGTALEYDGFDEFGEFENEVEAGGEVLVEKLEVNYQHNENIAFKMGQIFVPVGLGTERHKPSQYFTTTRHWSEATLIPQVWHETGINLITKWHDFTAQTLLSTGLNSEYFRSYNWVATGHQKRFETVNADDLALTLRIDYGNVKSGSGIGVSFYTGDTNGNRHNDNNIDASGNVTILGLHGAWQTDTWQISGQYLYGELSGSTAITQANKNTPGLRPGNFAQLGSQAESAYIEAAYNTQGLFELTKPLYVFSSWQYANPLKSVSQGVASDRFNKQELALGINYLPLNSLVVKAQVAQQNYAQNTLANTYSFSLSLGYYFSI